jgi:putative ABC transport system permease protein
MQPLRPALRRFSAHLWFNSLIVALLALGIGANTTMFSLVHGVLLKPLPYPQPGELVMIRKQPTASVAQQPGRGEMVTDKEYLAWQAAAPPAFRALAAYNPGAGSWRRSDGTERLAITNVTDTFFQLLGVSAHRGRLLTAEDAKPGAAPVAVLSYDFWQSRLGGRDGVLGTQLTLDGEAVTIVGVLPPSFQFSEPAQLWRPLSLHEGAGRTGHISIVLVRALARLRPGADLNAAQNQLDQISQRMWESLAPPPGMGPRMVAPPSGAPPASGPAGSAGRMIMGLGSGPVQLVPLQEFLAGAIRPTLWLLFGAVALVLLIACVNIANLQLARAAVRRHEMAVRAALGASRPQLATGLLVENLMPALLGGAFGSLLAFWGVRLARSLLAEQLPRGAPLEISLPVLGFALLLAAGTGLVFGLIPAWQMRRLAPQDALHTGGRAGLATPARGRWRAACVAFEVALALALVADAGLLLKSFLKLRSEDLGFRTDALNVTLPTGENLRPDQLRMLDPATQARINGRLRDFTERYRAALATVPGVRQAAIASSTPFAEYATMIMTDIDGYTPASDTPEPPFAAASVSPDYFSVLGIALRDGRLFTTDDGDGAPEVAIVNESFVRRFFPGQSVIGRRMVSPVHAPNKVTIVGVVADVRRNAQDRTPQAQAYFPLAQWPQARLTALLAFDGDSSSVGRAALEALRKLHPELPFDTPLTLGERLDRMLAPRKLVMNLLLGFAATAVALAALGIFGVMAYAVAQRTHEFGVRMALGADRARILRHVLAQAGTAIGLGVAGGLALGLASSKLLESALFAVARYDPLILFTAGATLAMVGLAASLVPALRASRVNPVDALRAE